MKDLTIKQLNEALEGVNVHDLGMVGAKTTIQDLIDEEITENELTAQAMIQVDRQKLVTVVMDWQSIEVEKGEIHIQCGTIDREGYAVVMTGGINVGFDTSY